MIATLNRIVRDIDIAEELAQDALVAALERWPRDGVPRNAGAWLMATAKRRAFDLLRHNKMRQRKLEAVAHELKVGDTVVQEPGIEAPGYIDDDLLRLIFTACHPALSPEARAALTLHLIAGLTTEEIARAFLVPVTTLAQRITRAKRTIAISGAAYETPSGSELTARLSSVLEVIYLIFNEGYTATSGDDWMRPELCREALRLGRILTALAPLEPEAHGLVALMEIQASRTMARIDAEGHPILLLEQNRALWDHLLIGRGIEALERAYALGGAQGLYALQAAIAACHGVALSAGDTDWPRIVSLYARLSALTGSPLIEINRAVAVSMSEGPAAALDIIEPVSAMASLQTYHLLWSVRGDILAKLGRHGEASADFRRAAFLTKNARERDLMLARADALASC